MFSTYVVPKMDVQAGAEVQQQAGPAAGRELCGAEFRGGAITRQESLGKRIDRDGQPDRARFVVW